MRTDHKEIPVLYSFRRCPYAMRARTALVYAGVNCEIREISLRDKPSAMLALSPKGTVPVLQLPDGTVLEESLDIINWACTQGMENGFYSGTDEEREDMLFLIQKNDTDFIRHSHRYKYASRFPEEKLEDNRAKAEVFIAELEQRLQTTKFLFADKPSIADIAVFPFIRQFSMVDEDWFFAQPYPKLQAWLEGFKTSDVFATVMIKYDLWVEGVGDVTYFNAAAC